MYEFIVNYSLLCNKLLSSNIFYYFLVINILLIIYLFCFTFTFFFKLILNLLFIVNISFLLSFINADFFSGFLLTAELPIILVFMIFYFHKNALQIDNIYKFNTRGNVYMIPLVAIFLFFVSPLDANFLFSFYNLCLNNAYSIVNKNDFFVLYIVNYKLSIFLPVIFAILIFFISILVILIFQLNKLIVLKNTTKISNVNILRKQNLLKQSVYLFKLIFFNKKV